MNQLIVVWSQWRSLSERKLSYTTPQQNRNVAKYPERKPDKYVPYYLKDLPVVCAHSGTSQNSQRMSYFIV